MGDFTLIILRKKFLSLLVFTAFILIGTIGQAAEKNDPKLDRITRVLPETTTRVLLSNSDINRIYCEGNRSIKDVIYSQEKGLLARTEGKNTFVKFLVKQLPASLETEFRTSPTELYVICDPDTVYTLIAAPRNIPAQTVMLSGTNSNIEANLSLMASLPFEKKITFLIKSTYTGNIPESFTQTKIGRSFDLFRDLDVFLNRIVNIEGEGLLLKEYILSVNEDSTTESITVMEKNFILPELTINPLGISLESLTIDRKKPGRLFIVEQRITQGEEK